MVVALPNIHIIGEVNLDDTDNFLASDDLVSYAVERGWHDPHSGKPFSFRKAYRPERDDPPDPRRWRGRQLAAGCEDLWPPRSPPPVGIQPKEKLTVEALAAILRFTGSPGTLSTPSTQEGAVFQLRQDMPPAIGCIYWRTTAEPSVSVLTPWYAGITQTPDSYYRPVEVREHLSLTHHFEPPVGTFDFDPKSSWWKFKRLQDVVREDFPKRIQVVRPAWAAFEHQILADQPRVEAQAMSLWSGDRQAAMNLLTDHSARLGAETCRQADQMADQFHGQNPESTSAGKSNAFRFSASSRAVEPITPER
jgi:dipeptidase